MGSHLIQAQPRCTRRHPWTCINQTATAEEQTIPDDRAPDHAGRIPAGRISGCCVTGNRESFGAAADARLV